MNSKSGTAKVFAITFFSIFVINIPMAAQIRDKTDSIYRLPAGTHIRVRMDGEISSRFSSVNDTFMTRVAVPVTVRNVAVIPEGTQIEGRVMAVSPADFGGRNGQIAIRMETLRFSDEVFRSIEGLPVSPFRAKRPNRFWPIVGGSVLGSAVGLATGSARGALIGAGLGGGLGAGAAYLRKGNEVGVKEDDVFEIELKKEVVLPVLDY